MKKTINFITLKTISLILLTFALISCKQEEKEESDSVLFSKMVDYIGKEYSYTTIEGHFSNKNLTFLKMNGGGLSTSNITHHVMQFTNLQRLEIQSMNLDTLPDFSNLKSLYDIDLSFNGIEGNVDFNKFPQNIKRIVLGFNKIDSFYNCDLVNLEKLVIINNNTRKIDCTNLLLDSCVGCEGWEETISEEDRRRYKEYNKLINSSQ